MLRLEVARLFGGWPWELDALPMSEYQDLITYYFETKKPPSDDGDDPVSAALD